ncbi:Mrp/NBP35 family ATP-binding protein [Actinotignum sanguinis]|uniref:Iron-sulfur cluster carrier protein n=3 Tax=Actinomycetaceae TaxID=2049 RepID=S2W0L9_9ACTO|nr:MULTISPECIES: Mrp/NBP35 family ATP-binding protein [Actinotignum]WPJ89845.1 Mrp/NBP35 family ATP-binding protein [Schaalia turicensis]EPD26107.1 hypothetical protein HMPREF9237_01382 [Actinotignum schaalii FB123-CNA-2]MDE1553113.1 Mrp/NBP35 family ATP-binding protein [Actinotignum sanguinis]MDE1576900.1 Mrp/NBP35 family ATP-binding protein [Actinotignum sanguinis]MDE1655485.1 Mrp/NBP35 family ATP-binding protein [Actinotignum sanguinis]
MPTSDPVSDSVPHSPAAPPLTKDRVLEALSGVIDPELRHPITELDMIHGLRVSPEGAVTLTVLLTTVHCPRQDVIEREVREAIAALAGVGTITITMGAMTPLQVQHLQQKLRGGRTTREISFARPDSPTRVIAVASGKGGVGKSSIAANLAVALAATGQRVGLIDADIYGFSIPGMMGVDTPAQQLNGMIIPPVAHGVKVMSIGMFVPGNTPVVWRGPMLHKALEQFFADVYWGDLDYVFLDLPPGTGDVAISLAQMLPRADILVVTTPQTAAADVAERAGAVSKQTEQTVIGVVENMSYLELPDGTKNTIFGSGGGQLVATNLSATLGYPVELLAQIPLEPALREGCDAGTPFVLDMVDSPARDMLRALAARIHELPRRAFPAE